MDLLKRPTKRHFTDAARAAALEVRRRNRELALPKNIPEVFVVRLAAAHLSFGWEIRRFGGVVLDKSGMGYASMQEAHIAGCEALAFARTKA